VIIKDAAGSGILSNHRALVYAIDHKGRFVLVPAVIL